jgi:hypothetical protein
MCVENWEGDNAKSKLVSGASYVVFKGRPKFPENLLCILRCISGKRIRTQLLDAHLTASGHNVGYATKRGRDIHLNPYRCL